MILLDLSHVSISTKAEPEAKTLVQTLYVEDDPGSRREGTGEKERGGGEINLRMHFEVIVSLKSVQTPPRIIQLPDLSASTHSSMG